MPSPTSTFQTKSKIPLRSIAMHPTVSGLAAVRGSREICLVDLHDNKGIIDNPDQWEMFKGDMCMCSTEYSFHD